MILIWWYISDFFTFIFDVVTLLVEWFTIFVDLLGESFEFVLDVASSMPAVFILPIVALAAISLIYKFLGRGEQS